MVRTARTLAAVVMVMCVGVIDQAEASVPRVRTDDPTVGALIGAAIARSATFRELVDTINGTDGLVFLQPGRCPGRVRACLSHAVIRSGPSRLLRILVDVNRAESDVIASIGHELRHAIEILEPMRPTQPFMRETRFGRRCAARVGQRRDEIESQNALAAS